jgi:uncharacterized small protein (DUF1192 family)
MKEKELIINISKCVVKLFRRLHEEILEHGLEKYDIGETQYIARMIVYKDEKIEYDSGNGEGYRDWRTISELEQVDQETFAEEIHLYSVGELANRLSEAIAILRYKKEEIERALPHLNSVDTIKVFKEIITEKKQ